MLPFYFYFRELNYFRCFFSHLLRRVLHRSFCTFAFPAPSVRFGALACDGRLGSSARKCLRSSSLRCWDIQNKNQQLATKLIQTPTRQHRRPERPDSEALLGPRVRELLAPLGPAATSSLAELYTIHSLARLEIQRRKQRKKKDLDPVLQTPTFCQRLSIILVLLIFGGLGHSVNFRSCPFIMHLLKKPAESVCSFSAEGSAARAAPWQRNLRSKPQLAEQTSLSRLLRGHLKLTSRKAGSMTEMLSQTRWCMHHSQDGARVSALRAVSKTADEKSCCARGRIAAFTSTAGARSRQGAEETKSLSVSKF